MATSPGPLPIDLPIPDRTRGTTAQWLRDMHTYSDAMYAESALLAGRSGGQTLIGGTLSGNNLVLTSTSHATKGTIRITDQATVEGSNLVVGKTDDSAGFVKIRGGGTTSAQVELFDLGTERARVAVPTGTTELQLNASASTTANQLVVQNNGKLRAGTATVPGNIGFHFAFAASASAMLIESLTNTDSASATHFMTARNAATTVSNVSIEAFSLTGANCEMVFRTGATGQDTYGTRRMTIMNTGNVGIGIAIPVTLLDVAGTIRGQIIRTGNGSAGAKTMEFSNAAGIGTFSWNPTTTRTLTFPDVTGTVVVDGPPSFYASSATSFATTSATDVVVTGMTLTPGAGTYYVSYCGQHLNSAGGTQRVTIYSNGVAVAESAFDQSTGSGNTNVTPCTARVTVAAAQAIDVRVRTSAGTLTIVSRNFTLIKVT